MSRPSDIILTCTICQAPLSNTRVLGDANQGLRKDAESPTNGPLTKFWLTECAHLTCATHLEGVLFHSDQKSPRAPCPLCILEKNDHTDKTLYFINGITKGEYDIEIPEAYFQTPPAQLDRDDAESEALRFQYLSLVRYGINIRDKLQRSEVRLRNWEGKKAEIIHSLNNVAPLRDELINAGIKLQTLGQNTSSIQATLNLLGVGLFRSVFHQQPNARSLQLPTSTLFIEDAEPHPERHPIACRSRLASASVADLHSLSREDRLSRRQVQVSPQTIAAKLNPRIRSSVKRDWRELKSDQTQFQAVLRCSPEQEMLTRDLMPPPLRRRSDEQSLQDHLVDKSSFPIYRDIFQFHQPDATINQIPRDWPACERVSRARITGPHGEAHPLTRETYPDTVMPLYSPEGEQISPHYDLDLQHRRFQVEWPLDQDTGRQHNAFRCKQPMSQPRGLYENDVSSPTQATKDGGRIDQSRRSSNSFRTLRAHDGELIPNLPRTPLMSSLQSRHRGTGISSNLHRIGRRPGPTRANSSVHRQRLSIPGPKCKVSIASPHFMARQRAESTYSDLKLSPNALYRNNPNAGLVHEVPAALQVHHTPQRGFCQGNLSAPDFRVLGPTDMAPQRRPVSR